MNNYFEIKRFYYLKHRDAKNYYCLTQHLGKEPEDKQLFNLGKLEVLLCRREKEDKQNI